MYYLSLEFTRVFIFGDWLCAEKGDDGSLANHMSFAAESTNLAEKRSIRNISSDTVIE